MGAIRDVINSFDDSTDLLKEAKAHLETLQDGRTVDHEFTTPPEAAH